MGQELRPAFPKGKMGILMGLRAKLRLDLWMPATEPHEVILDIT